VGRDCKQEDKRSWQVNVSAMRRHETKSLREKRKEKKKIIIILENGENGRGQAMLSFQ
jgi:hypothetical protein